MRAAQAAHHGFPAVGGPDLVAPGAGRVDDDPAGNLERVAGDEVAHGDAGHPAARITLHRLDARVVERRTPAALRLTQHAEHEAGVVRRRLGVIEARAEPVRGDPGDARRHRFRGLPIVGPGQCHHVVGGQAQPGEPGRLTITLVGEERVVERPYERGLLEHESPALAQRLEGGPELRVLEVAETAVDHLAGAAGGAGGEVVRLEERGAHPGLSRCEQHRGPGDPATDDDEIHSVVQPCAGELPTGHGGGRSTEGFMIPEGSADTRAARIMSTPRGDFSPVRYDSWSVPTPCWWLIVPPAATTAELIAPFIARQSS